jgi:hypothetical protein
MRNGENIMEVLYWQQFCLTFFKPFGLGQSLTFGTMAVTAGVISNSFKSATVASFQVPTEIRCSADLDSMHHLQMRQRFMPNLSPILTDRCRLSSFNLSSMALTSPVCPARSCMPPIPTCLLVIDYKWPLRRFKLKADGCSMRFYK